ARLDLALTHRRRSDLRPEGFAQVRQQQLRVRLMGIGAEVAQSHAQVVVDAPRQPGAVHAVSVATLVGESNAAPLTGHPHDLAHSCCCWSYGMEWLLPPVAAPGVISCASSSVGMSG